MNPSPIQDPQAKPEPPRILLSEAVSRFLDGTDENAFTIIARDTHPGTPDRWAISLHPVSNDAWRGIAAILAGTHHTVRNRPSKAAQDSPACHPSPGQLDAAQGAPEAKVNAPAMTSHPTIPTGQPNPPANK